jgi:hypothetical protein
MALAHYGIQSSKPKVRSGDGPHNARRNADYASREGDEETAEKLRTIAGRMDSKRTEMSRFQMMCQRWDNLYYPDTITEFGADHWPGDPNLAIPGKSHVSLNVYPVYVDVPASLQSVPPVENIAPADPRMEANRELAAAVERVYFAWKDSVDFETKSHKAAVTKALYGRTAAKVWWNEEIDQPEFSVVDQPRNLWMGFSSTDYTRLDWVVYAYRIHPDTATEEYGLECDFDEDGYPFFPQGGTSVTWNGAGNQRSWLANDQTAMIEVLDYWYKIPKDTPQFGKKTEMVTWNCIIVGNKVVREEKHEEYGGLLPYVPVFNTYIPGVPDGRSEFYDIEQLIREKDERLSAGAQMISKTVGGQYWQLTGPEAPDTVPPGVQPQPDKVTAPGAGNRIESIDPWMPEFQFDTYLDRIDRELSDVSGLNDLLRGMAPAQVLSSGKAINALIANYEARIRMKRDLFYEWRRNLWDLVVVVWSHYNDGLADAFAQANRLTVKAPSLTPRDEMETSTMAANNVNSKLWSLRRGMDVVGVEDPEAEIDIVKEERTDASLFPADVQTQAALASQLQQLQMTAQQMQPQGPPGGPPGGGAPLDQLAQQAAMMAPGGMPMLNGPGEQAVMPPEGLTPGAPAPGGAPMSGPGFNAMAQTMVKEGEPSNRLMLQQPIGPPPTGGPPV